MKGIILAGGSGTRLHPITQAVSKQLLPVYDKPMIYYPLSVLMLAGIRDILIISTPHDLPMFRRLLGDGAELGLRLDYAEQAAAERAGRGVPDRRRARRRRPGRAGARGQHLPRPGLLRDAGPGPRRHRAPATRAACCSATRCATRSATAWPSSTPTGRLLSIEEKPEFPRSDRAVVGLYLYDNERARDRPRAAPVGPRRAGDHRREPGLPGARRARLVDLGRGFAWLDTGTHESLLEAGEYVRVLENRQGIRIACIEEIAMRMGFIDPAACYALGERLAKSGYGEYVMDMAKSFRPKV